MVALAIAVFTGLAVEVVLGRGIVGVDVAVRDRTVAFNGSSLTAALSHLVDVVRPELDVTVLLGVAAAVARRRGSWRPLAFAATTIVVLAVGVLAVKYGVDRPSPFPFGDADIRSGRGAFPSGHTASFLVCGGGVVLLLVPFRWRAVAWWGLAMLTLMVAAALVMANFHWLSDVLGGAALGVATLGVAPQRWAAARPSEVPTRMPAQAEPSTADNVRLPGMTLALPASLAVWLGALGLALAVVRPQGLNNLIVRAVAAVAPDHVDAAAGAPVVTLLWLAGASCAAVALLALARGSRAH